MSIEELEKQNVNQSQSPSCLLSFILNCSEKGEQMSTLNGGNHRFKINDPMLFLVKQYCNDVHLSDVKVNYFKPYKKNIWNSHKFLVERL